MRYFWDYCVSTHSRPKAAGHGGVIRTRRWMVSTHSRPKAAGMPFIIWINCCCSFNTQPPEGGWFKAIIKSLRG